MALWIQQQWFEPAALKSHWMLQEKSVWAAWSSPKLWVFVKTLCKSDCWPSQEFNFTSEGSGEPWLGVQVNSFFHPWLSHTKEAKISQEKKNLKIYSTLFSNIVQFRRIFHILLFLQGQWRQSQKSWTNRNLSQNFHAQTLPFHYFKTFPQQQLRTGLSNVYDGARGPVKAHII